jgi:HAD superfamily hydrolase (TIGR01484 family)
MLACDLDETLFHHDKRPGDVCVEHKDGRENSFMTVEALELLALARERVCFVPVTGRALFMYNRIDLFQRMPPEYALAGCGGVLLRDGAIDRAWQKETALLAAPAKDALAALFDALDAHPLVPFVKQVDDVFLFAYSDESARVMAELREKHDGKDALEFLEFLIDGPKIHILPRAVSKGKAVLRLKHRLGATHFIAAGDSAVDYSMLEAADLAIVPDEKTARLAGLENAVLPDEGTDFAAFILRYVLRGFPHGIG